MTVRDRFKKAVETYPEKIAIHYEDNNITYKDLYDKTNLLSQIILEKLTKNEPPVRIALLIEDRIHSIVSILSILNIGSAFIPLDPEDPDDRIQTILEDARPRFIITSAQELDRLKKMNPEIPIIQIEEIDERGDSYKNLFQQSLPKIDDLAYILYTSGTTGKPKGVCQSQRNLIQHVDVYSKKLDINEQDIVSLLYTLSFSAANMDIFGALFHGAKLCAYNTRKYGVQKLHTWIEEKNISILHAVPTVLKNALSHINAAHIFQKVKSIDLGGESLSYKDIIFFRSFFKPECTIINHLAATEMSVIAQYEIPSDFHDTHQLIPVGKSPENVEIEIIDDKNQSVKRGDQGKIVISSPYLALEYWNQKELTQRYFKENLNRPGWKSFFTDDMGYFDANDNLIFIGRKGSRIKIRGQSVDLHEVENALKKCPYILEAIALPYNEKNEPEIDSIAAHIIFKENSIIDFVEIRKDLAKTLPHYMLPNLFMRHNSFPQTSNGKIDRQYLSALKIKPNQDGVNSIGAIGFLESNIAQLFKKIIKLDHMPNRKDDFFLLGGDSMGVIELQLSLNQIVNKEVPIKEILWDSTVVGLAKLLEKVSHDTASGSSSSLIVQLSDKGQLSPLFIVHGRAGQAPVSPHFINLLGGDQPIYAFQAKGLNGVELPAKNIKEAALDYIAEMKKIQPVGPYYLGAMCVGGYVAMLMAQILMEQGEKVFPLLLIDPAAPPFTAPPEVMDNKDFMKKFVASAKENVIRNAQQGKYQVDLSNEFRRNAAFYIAVHFVRILSRFKPTPYSGEVCMIVSDERMGAHGWGNNEKFKGIFSGKVKVFKIHGKHDEILDSKNPEFTGHLKTALTYIRNYKLSV